MRTLDQVVDRHPFRARGQAGLALARVARDRRVGSWEARVFEHRLLLKAVVLVVHPVPQNVGEIFSLIEREMIKGPWLLGENYSICDPYLFTLTRWLPGDSVERGNFPKIDAHFQAMMERGAVQEVLQHHS